MVVVINYFAVAMAGIASMAIGFLWYSKPLLGKQWMEAKGYTEESLKEAQKGMGPMYLLSFAAALLTAYVLAHVMQLSSVFYGYGAMQTGFTSALFMWLGFVMPVQLTNEIFGDTNWKLFAINTTHQLASLLVMVFMLAWFSV